VSSKGHMALNTTKISVIIPVGSRQADAGELYAEYKAALTRANQPHEFIVVLDGPRPAFASRLEKLVASGEPITVIGLTRSFGEATAIMAGFARSSGETILTLPAYFQIDGGEITKLLDALRDKDVVTGRRWPRAGGPLERLRRWVFHGLLSRVTQMQLRDVACGARAFKRQVLEEIHLYGDQHRFLSVLADRQGFRAAEVDVRQSSKDRMDRIYRPREYARSFLDIFTVFFLVRFTKKPLRFFGMMGLGTFGVGSLWMLLLVVQRAFFEQALADRPALLLASLLLVLGLQLFALGLLGELIIFTHARQLKDYRVAEVIQFTHETAAEPRPESKFEDSLAAT
jgi:glycosyltransferase involved in cell wall biosynthesis